MNAAQMVTMVYGPATASPPPNSKVVKIETTEEMLERRRQRT